MAEGRGQKRIIDRFVKYPYPHNTISNYRKDFIDKDAAPVDKDHRK